MSLRGVVTVVVLACALAGTLDRLVSVPDEVITPDGGLLRLRLAGRELMKGAPLTPEERARVQATLVDEELLLAYARSDGLDRSSYVERRLAKKIRYLLAGTTSVPSDGELRALYDANLQRFVAPGSDTPLPFERVKEQLRAMLAGPAAQAVIDARVRELVHRYTVVMGE